MITLTTRKELSDVGYGDVRADLATLSSEFHRLLRTNPMSIGDDEPVQILGTSDGRVIGRMNIIAGRVCVAGHVVPILWGSGFTVSPEHRNSGVGAMILLAMHGLPVTVAVIGPSQLAIPLYRKLRWVELVVPRYVLPRRARPIAEAYLRNRRLREIADSVGDAVLRPTAKLIATVTALRTRGLFVERVGQMPQSLDVDLRNLERRAYCPRSAAWVDWIISARSGDPGLWLVRERCGQVVGYFVVSHRHHESAGGGRWKDVVMGSVKDWMTFDADAVTDAQLVALAIVELIKRDVDAIDVCVADPGVGYSLRLCGMVRMGDMHVMFRPVRGTPLAEAEYRDVRAWRLRPADGDYFLF